MDGGKENGKFEEHWQQKAADGAATSEDFQLVVGLIDCQCPPQVA